MKLTDIVKEPLELAWWVEIFTANPWCIYYFGPFTSTEEADKAKVGYIEDLELEGTQGIMVEIKWCQPTVLTAFEYELTDNFNNEIPQILHSA